MLGKLLCLIGLPREVEDVADGGDYAYKVKP